MRIISSFKDYYDCGQRYGYDPHITYVRETSTEKIQIRLPVVNNYEFDCNIIGFCGKIYRIYYNFKKGTYQWEKPPKKSGSYALEFNPLKDEIYTGFFERAPIFMIKGHNVQNEQLLILNPNLSKLHFQKIFDPIQAYQQLSMYLGQHVKEPDVPNPPDKIMVEIKGFDKHSFRKDKRGESP